MSDPPSNVQDSVRASTAKRDEDGPSERKQLALGLAADATNRVESFHVNERGVVERTVRLHNGESNVSVLVGSESHAPGVISASEAERLYLRSTDRPPDGRGVAVRCVDLFSGCGGFSLGAQEAARALGRRFRPLAVDFDSKAAAVFEANFGEGSAIHGDVLELIDRAPGSRTSPQEKLFCRQVGTADLLIGGPPCQGHSALNYRTRHRDDRNELYGVMVRAAEILDPPHVLIENVPGALRDRQGVVQRSIEGLSKLGYQVSHAVLDASRVGVPQSRRRLLVVASKATCVTAATLETTYQVPERSIRWAIDDLIDKRDGLLDEPASSAPDTRRRIDYLFDNDLFELPNAQRPPCHRGDHSYVSIYGRLGWNTKAQTITTGFYSMCMGRYVHPSRRRTITAHEAARLQFFPDFFDFSPARNRGELSRMIGNAVPSKLSYMSVLELLR